MAAVLGTTSDQSNLFRRLGPKSEPSNARSSSLESPGFCVYPAEPALTGLGCWFGQCWAACPVRKRPEHRDRTLGHSGFGYAALNLTARRNLVYNGLMESFSILGKTTFACSQISRC